MSTRSNSGTHRHDSERPTLPPIRDLFRDLRPHESPSLTLARLRVSDDPAEGSYGYVSSTSSSRGIYADHRPAAEQHSKPRTSQSYPHHLQDPPSSRTSSRYGPDDGGRSPAPIRLHETHPRYGAPPYDNRRENDRHPAIHGLPGYASPEWTSHTPHHRDPIASGYYPDPGTSEYSTGPRNSSARYPPPSHRSRGYSQSAGHAWPISTTVPSVRSTDDEKTPVACYGVPVPPLLSQHIPEDNQSSSALSKYECSFCGKGFNRPSSLKIHLNSHTGEKPFVCPVDTCGRSFSVLSNMRRHARVHSQPSQQQPDPSSDEESEQSSSLTHSHNPSPGSTRGSTPSYSRAPEISTSSHIRRSSNVSASSSQGSRKSHSYASDEEDPINGDHPEKRTRRYPK